MGSTTSLKMLELLASMSYTSSVGKIILLHESCTLFEIEDYETNKLIQKYCYNQHPTLHKKVLVIKEY